MPKQAKASRRASRGAVSVTPGRRLAADWNRTRAQVMRLSRNYERLRQEQAQGVAGAARSAE